MKRMIQIQMISVSNPFISDQQQTSVTVPRLTQQLYNNTVRPVKALSRDKAVLVVCNARCIRLP